ncbi:nucleoid-structuring protein H-NS [Reichenbachiella agarivorans]|uniref:Nucleoid-structuring protein H-NS n=1 Tax=Reichenbachiella agarivorans TaxID=2979464 RepID=A0ABY6CTE5_9BACT|nr:nucleoid-structuring protein H-NS [Reichenbachiella agarivorans]UXP31515.1 nucleoid-structuring protein H-NS [Reichenbachiella agarivorans]
MKKYTFNISPLAVVIILSLAVGFTSCKGKKKLTKGSDAPVVVTSKPEPMADPEEPEEVEPVVKKLTKEQKLSNYFEAIATAPSTTSANASIQEALGMFSNGDAPVLIVIYRAGSAPDYDEPTTITNYLHYLKDTKNNKAQIEEIVYDTNGNIKELVLKK